MFRNIIFVLNFMVEFGGRRHSNKIRIDLDTSGVLVAHQCSSAHLGE
jgi:hypothetical protein